MADDAFFVNLLARIESKCDSVPDNLGCILWQGGLKQHGGYGVLKVKFPGGRFRVLHAHRLRYMCHVQSVELPAHYDVSHTCHNALCMNIDHLVCEHHNINMARLGCRSDGRCSREHQPPCIFH